MCSYFFVNMRKYRIYSFFVAFIIAIISIVCFTISYMYYAPATILKTYPILPKSSDSIKIAIIGDSWAFFHKDHSCEIASIVEKGIHKKTIVLSHGICGARSGKIYSKMFADKGETFKDILVNSPHFCVIFAGVNDTYTKTGAQAYATNMMQITHQLLSWNITPIMVEIPNYDIKGAYDRQTYTKKILRKLSMIVTKSEIDCRASYREQFVEKLQLSKTGEQIIYIESDCWNDNSSLYKDCLHLNDKGYLALDSCIARHIVAFLQRNNNDTTNHY